MTKKLYLPETSGATWKKVLFTVGISIGLTGAILAFIFTFFTGFKINYGESYGYSTSENYYILSYFGPILNFLKNIKEMRYTTFEKISIYFSSIMIMLIAIATFITVMTFMIISICRIVKALKGKETKNPVTPVALTVVSYILGSLALKFFFVRNENYSYSSSRTQSSDITLNSATILGIVVSLLCLLIMLAFIFAIKGKNLKNGNLTKTVFSSIIVVLSFIVIFVLSSVAIPVEYDRGYVAISFGYILLKPNPFDGEVKDFIYCLFGVLIFIALLFLFTATIIKQVKNISQNDENNSTLGLNISSLVLSVIYFILIVLEGKSIINQIDDNATFTLNVAGIFTIILSIALLVIEIINLSSKHKAEVLEQKQEEQIQEQE